MEEIDCPLCNCPGQYLLEQDGWTAKKCPICRLVFLSPRPSATETARLYREDQAHQSASSHLADYGSPANRLETSRNLDLIGALRPSGRLLELGPGSGALLVEARRRGYDVEAVELNPEQVRFIRDELGLPCSESLDALDGQFDVVYHRDVLSHFSDPLAVFRAIHDLLVPGGVHVFETGSGDFAPRFAKLFPSFQFPDHLFFFSDKSLELLLERTGFLHLRTERYAIGPELAVVRILRHLRGSGRAAPDEPTRVGVAVPPTSSRLRRGRQYLRYALRYWVGRVAPKKARPQTMIVVAAKPTTGCPSR